MAMMSFSQEPQFTVEVILDFIKKCKIVATLGPASSKPEMIEKLMIAGVDVFRLNFSHGSHDTHQKNITNIRRISAKVEKNVAILQDLQGPKIRCGSLLNDAIEIVKDQAYFLKYDQKPQTNIHTIPIDYQYIVKDVEMGHRVLMDDGFIEFEIKKIHSDSVEVVALNSALLKNRKGINFPDTDLSLPCLTSKDRKDLEFGIKCSVDLVALSFVQNEKDIHEIKSILSEHKKNIPVIAKIEKLNAISNIENITKAADGIMVARGDLGVEAYVDKVPILQRTVIKTAAKYGKPVIVATQMLESMIESPTPSVAEMNDVANGVLEGADCLMLSGEVASGKYPLETVKKMTSIIQEVEHWRNKQDRSVFFKISKSSHDEWQEHEAIARAAYEAYVDLDATAIVCMTLSGSIAKTIAKWRPNAKIIAVSPKKNVVNELALVWGVTSIHNPDFLETEELLTSLPEILQGKKLVKKDDLIILTAGVPMHSMKATNMIKINRV